MRESEKTVKRRSACEDPGRERGEGSATVESVTVLVFLVLASALFVVYARGQWHWTADFLKSLVKACLP